jgi:hypothetical protein
VTGNVIVTQEEPKYIIIGVDIIMRFPQILTSLVNLSHETNDKERTTCLNLVIDNDHTEEAVTQQYSEIFSDVLDGSKACKTGEHEINTEDAKPVFCRNDRIPIYFETAIDQEIKKYLDTGIIRPSSSPWCSRIQPALKPDGSIRMCIDQWWQTVVQCTTTGTLDGFDWYTFYFKILFFFKRKISNQI